MIELVFESDAKIHAQILVELMQNVMLLRIQHSVIVYQALEVMHSPDAQQHQPHIYHSIHASHRHAVKILFVLLKMASENVIVFHHILEMLTVLDVDQNVFTIRIVLVEWLVFDNIVEILAQAFVVLRQSVALLIMFQFAHAPEDLKVIHSLAVDHFLVYVSITIIFKENYHGFLS